MRSLLPFALFSVLLCVLPPTQILGYEASYATAIFFAVLGGPLLLRAGLRTIAIALALPAVALTLNAFFVKNCNFGEGYTWYAVHALPQALFAIVLVRALIDVFGRTRGLVLYVIFLVVCALLTIASPIVGPSMRVYSVPFGFFAGSLYDEALPIPRALYWHQLMTLLYASALWLWRFAGPHPTHTRLAALCFVSALGIQLGGSRLGFDVRPDDLRAALPRTVLTEHLMLHFAPGGAIEKRIGEVWPEAERTAQTIAQKIAGDDSALAERLRQEPTDVWIYESLDEKERLLGAKYTQFARPWKREVHVLAQDTQMRSLGHELVHAFARVWAVSLLQVPAKAWLMPNMGLVEGLAVALANDEDSVLFESMAALKKLGKLPDLRALLGAGFYADSSARAYTATGAFVAWLIETRGIALVRSAYALGALDAAIEEPMDRVLAEYDAFLAATPVDDLTARAYADQFKERPLYKRVCGRDFARRRADAVRLADAGRLDDAEAIYDAMGKDDPGDSSIALSKLELDRRRAPFSAAAALRFEAGARAAIAAKEISEPQRVRYFDALAVKLAARGAIAEADLALKEAQALATRSEDVRRLAIERALLSRDDAAEVIVALDAGTDATRALAALEEAFHRTPFDPLIAYLLARRFAIGGDVTRAYRYGLVAADEEEALPEPVRFELRRLLLDWAVRLRIASDYAPHCSALHRLAKTPLERRTTAESLERSRFYEQHQTW
ncbi:MAG: hypothetical protein IT381_30055 [Deltaproteobacteria bacterium]|nr:hypothetical protein [Deltaproteobacteria bacterium]